jgi:hypothetical protein
MTPRELLAMIPQSVSHDVYRVLRELPEVDTDVLVDTDESLEWREYAYHNFDGRRIWLLASIHFRGRAALIVQRAGREGDDHHERIVVDVQAYADLVRYAWSLPKKWPDMISYRCAELDTDDEELTQFYGHSLDEILGHVTEVRS